MEFDIPTGREVLARTPNTLDAWLRGLPHHWVDRNEGGDTWSPFDIVGHLISGEESDWIPRARSILAHGDSATFEPFNRTAMVEANRSRTIEELLDRFHEARRVSLSALDALHLTAADLDRTGRHPEFGVVTLGQLLATWVAHDLAHLGQIARVMARQYAVEVGPWRAYLRILQP